MPLDNPNNTDWLKPITAFAETGPTPPASLPMSGRERLRVLADFLDTVPPAKFNIRDWTCGTTACAIGWCPSIPSFAAAGWRLIQGLPFFEGRCGYGSAMAFFGMSLADAKQLFSTTSNPKDITARAVATNIRSYLEQDADRPVSPAEGRTPILSEEGV